MMVSGKPFAALFSAVTACAQSDRDMLLRALKSAPAQDLYKCAVRHKCAGLLLFGASRMRLHDPLLSELMQLLRRYASAATTDAQGVRAQAQGVVDALRERRISHALLKGSARLAAGDSVTEWTHAYDIDVFVPREQADDAASALLARGYRYKCDSATARGYRQHHHHLAPLLPPVGNKAVELHVALMPQTHFSVRTDWRTLQRHLQSVSGSCEYAFDAFGRALHMALHGAGLYRLGDAAQIALELRERPELYAELNSFAAAEQIQPVPLRAVLLAGALLAGMKVDAGAAERRYLAWAIVREDLPGFCNGRMQLADAWFAGGRALNDPVVRLAFPTTRRYDGTATGLFERSRILAARIAAATAGCVLAGNARRRTLLQGR